MDSVEVPPSGGSLEIGNTASVMTAVGVENYSSPFGGIPRNWKLDLTATGEDADISVPPSGGSLEIGNIRLVPPVRIWNVEFPLRGDP